MAEEKAERKLEKTLWGFRPADVILRVVITKEGATVFQPFTVVAILDDKVLWAENDAGDQARINSPENLMLFKRPYFPYKVKDKVQALNGKAKAHEGLIVLMNPFTNELLVDFSGFQAGHQGDDKWNEPWFPKGLRTKNKSCLWQTVDNFVISTSTGPKIFAEKGVAGKMKPMAAETELAPVWLDEVFEKTQAGLGHIFTLSGNVFDWQKDQRGNYLSLAQYLEQVFEQREIFMYYSISAGLQFAKLEMEKLFRCRYVREVGKDCQLGAAERKLGMAMQEARDKVPLDQLIGKMPEDVFPVLEKAFIDADDSGNSKLSKILVINFAENIFPNNAFTGNQSRVDRINAETILRWAKDYRVRESGALIFLVADQLADLDQCLREGHTEIVPIRISKPDDASRIKRWGYLRAIAGAELDVSLDEDVLGRVTNGLSLKQLDELQALSRVRAEMITLAKIRQRKQELLQEEFGGLLKVVRPDHGMEYFGGRPELVSYLRQLQFNVLRGIWRRVPVGILAPGPPGTGKTTLWKCYAFETGMNCVELGNLRQMWVGASEADTDKVLTAIDDMSPVVVLEDEADQSEAARDAPQGDSGVSNRLRQKKFIFCSDPRRRGRVIWVRISNRADLIDPAYLRKGRSDEVIPFVLPSEEDMAEIFRVKFMEYGIPTDIDDFAPFAKAAKKRIYVTGADIDWMVREADIKAGNVEREYVDADLLSQAVDDWELQTNSIDIDYQIVLALRGSSKRLRPDGWPNMLVEAEERLKKSLTPPCALDCDLLKSKGGTTTLTRQTPPIVH
ncbi:ATP-binding protein [Candidatus Falkowbacteria bacterium]|nr:ATP-binding protein [Candidatus Falkowbacteria bacterium]